MNLLNPWIFFALLPLYLIYKKNRQQDATLSLKLFFASIIFMIIALSRPVLENSMSEEKFDAQEFIIALDVSYSMQANDIVPTRYEVAKQAIAKLLKSRQKDRFSLFAFTSNPLLISPPTTDYTISLAALNALQPKYILTKSTNLYTLFETIAKIQQKHKKLILFTDGGDQHNIGELANFLNQHQITPYIIATATQKGAALKKNGRYIKDIYSSIVVSKINPILKELANQTGGKYYELQSIDVIDQLVNDLQDDHTYKQNVQVKTYKELFIYPLAIALVLFLLAVTKLQKLIIPLLALLFAAQNTEASLLDFIYLNKAQSYYKNKEYKQAATTFSMIDPSVQSYYNIATSYYKAAHYKTALTYYSQIQTKDPVLKQKIFYNMGNCAVQLKRYDRAKRFYIQALALGEDEDALYNLNLLRKLQLKTGVNIADMLPPKNAKEKKNSSKSTGKQKDNKKNKGGKSNSKQSASQGLKASKSTKKSSQQSTVTSKNKNIKYNIGYKAYEIINKGYTNEKEPW